MKIGEAIRQNKFENNHQMATVNLIYTYNWINSLHTSIFRKYGLMPQHYNVLRILKGRYPNAICPGEIKEVMLDKNPDLTRLIDKLVNLGYASRKLSEENRRKMNISITLAGLDMLDKIKPELDKYYGAFQGNLTEDEAQTLSDLLDKLRG